MCWTSRGKGSYCIYEDLQGSTEYEMRLRFKCDDNFGPYGNPELFETPSEPVTAFDLHKAIKFEDIDALNAMLSERLATFVWKPVSVLCMDFKDCILNLTDPNKSKYLLNYTLWF